MTSIKLTNIAKAQTAWGIVIPDWIIILAEACDRESQSAISRKVGYSASAISQVLSNTYQNGDIGVLSKLCGEHLWQKPSIALSWVSCRETPVLHGRESHSALPMRIMCGCMELAGISVHTVI